MFGNKVNITIGTSDPIVNAGKNSSDINLHIQLT